VKDLASILRLDEFEELARERLDEAAYAYYAGGAADEVTLRENASAFGRRHLRPRVLVDVSKVDPSTTFLGTEVSLPVGLAPNALHALADPEGECATARAAAERGVLMCLSSFASRSLEDVAAASDGPKWFQLYFHKDSAITEDVIRRAVDAGYGAIVLTVDVPVPGYREREFRHPLKIESPDVFGVWAPYTKTAGVEFLDLLAGIINPALTWADVDWTREKSGLPVLVKGILTAEDARLAAEHGASGIVVSNHGGRQLDRVLPAIDALEDIAQAVGDRAEVYLDGGVRRGTDVIAALALGARGVFIGRPYLYALAAGGERGVVRALELMWAEITNALALLGTTEPAQVTRAHLT
jgi:isopentenyl diphosphate isomerase/L-lactate dehydrogenase-like FMN-dependent dehydrogenase